MVLHYINAFGSEVDFHQKGDSKSISDVDLEKIVSDILLNGIESDFFGKILPNEVVLTGKNFREHLIARGLNSRQRAVLELLAMEDKVAKNRNSKVYAPEAVTDLALVLRGRYPYFAGSEYINNPERRAEMFPVEHQDLQSLTFRSSTFDAVVSCDVLEHVPSIEAAIDEMYRILKPGGLMLATHPFTWRQQSLARSSIVNGEVVHHMTPEYHGNPVDPDGSLVYTVPGWDILELCRTIGFRHAEMVMIISSKLGIIGVGPPFINVLRARK
jgi:SAM-dependent methyltransferase